MRNHEAPIYREIINLDRTRAIEKLLRFKTRLLAIKELSRGFLSNEAQWIEVPIKKLSRRQKVSQWIELAIESYRECVKKKLKGLDR